MMNTRRTESFDAVTQAAIPKIKMAPWAGSTAELDGFGLALDPVWVHRERLAKVVRQRVCRSPVLLS